MVSSENGKYNILSLQRRITSKSSFPRKRESSIINYYQQILDSRFRGNDGKTDVNMPVHSNANFDRMVR
jgi:hypothetical protein